MNDSDTIARIEGGLNEPEDCDHFDECPAVLDPNVNCECVALADAAEINAAEDRMDARRDEGCRL